MRRAAPLPSADGRGSSLLLPVAKRLAPGLALEWRGHALVVVAAHVGFTQVARRPAPVRPLGHRPALVLGGACLRDQRIALLRQRGATLEIGGAIEVLPALDP